jgi:hypothetical protein
VKLEYAQLLALLHVRNHSFANDPKVQDVPKLINNSPTMPFDLQETNIPDPLISSCRNIES